MNWALVLGELKVHYLLGQQMTQGELEHPLGVVGGGGGDGGGGDGGGGGGVH